MTSPPRASRPDLEDQGPSTTAREMMVRELHDGLLQVLTGTSLELRAILRLWDSDPNKARSRLIAVGDAISDEQRELRFLVDEFRDDAAEENVQEVLFRDRIEFMLDTARSIWGISLDADIDPASNCPSCPGVVLRVIQEAIANAVRHGGAEHISLRIRQDRSGIGIQVADDGCGFPFAGCIAHEELMVKRMGPVSLKGRVLERGGRMEIESSERGATIRMWLPVGAGKP